MSRAGTECPRRRRANGRILTMAAAGLAHGTAGYIGRGWDMTARQRAFARVGPLACRSPAVRRHGASVRPPPSCPRRGVQLQDQPRRRVRGVRVRDHSSPTSGRCIPCPWAAAPPLHSSPTHRTPCRLEYFITPDSRYVIWTRRQVLCSICGPSPGGDCGGAPDWCTELTSPLCRAGLAASGASPMSSCLTGSVRFSEH